jgi:hypothetical protein
MIIKNKRGFKRQIFKVYLLKFLMFNYFSYFGNWDRSNHKDAVVRGAVGAALAPLLGILAWKKK